MTMMSYRKLTCAAFLVALALGVGADIRAAKLAISRIYIEYNSTANDLGYHVFLDGEDWRALKIINPDGRTIYDVKGRGPYRDLGMTEMFFEGAEPSLDDFPLDKLLALFPEGKYTFIGTTVNGERIEGSWKFTHAVPAPVPTSASVNGDEVTIQWQAVSGPPEGFPNRKVDIVGYQVIVNSFQVTLPASSRKVTLPEEFVKTLAPGKYEYEVLAIEKGANQTITADSFVIP